MAAGFFKKTIPVIRAVEDVSFSVEAGETLCIVGESGCGKSTVARLLMRLVEPTAGRVLIDGTDIAGLKKDALHAWRRRMQMVFQDPYSSLNPRLTAGQIITEPVENFERLSRKQRQALAADLLRKVGMSPEMMHRLPSELSGGQRQRLGIARALSLNPSLIIADEAVSALDVSVQAQILNLLLDLQQQMGIAFVFISHDLGVVEHIGASRRGHVSGADRGTRPMRGALRQAGPSLHRGADRGSSGAGSDAGSAGGARRGRGAKPHQSAERLRVSPALPARGRALPHRRAAFGADGRRARRGLSCARSGYRHRRPSRLRRAVVSSLPWHQPQTFPEA